MPRAETSLPVEPRWYQVNVRLDPATHARLLEEAESDERSRASVLRIALKEYLDRLEGKEGRT